MSLWALPTGLLAIRIGTTTAVAAGALVSSALAAWLGFTSRGLRAEV